ncbi:gamma-aminobutyric acid receptor subunit beta isoform X2 [Nematostella vectensis]|nr:gamma-aminobutyric acid receptor subunit beta isoform X2 [Nematostella vectensis]
MEYKLFGYFRQFWKDERLANRLNKSVVLKGDEITKMWRPDPFCYNARESSLTASDDDINSMMTIHPNGDVVYSRMTIITAECEMKLHDFPMDEQQCHLKLGSYSYSTKNIVYRWQSPLGVTVRNKNLAQFIFTYLELSEYEEIYGMMGNYSILQVDFAFKRRLGYFLIQVYAPDIFVVLLSWIVFWMDKDDMGNRMALGITTILTIMFLLGSVNAAMPRVSYPKALDWYLMVSFSLVFLVLIECMIVFVISKYKNDRRKRRISKILNSGNSTKRVPWLDSLRKRETNGNARAMEKSELLEMNPSVQHDESNVPTPPKPRLSINDLTGSHEEELHDSDVDKFARIVFPMVFIVFNILYWCIYLKVF